MSKSYASLQQKAYATQSVTTAEVTDLQKQINDYVNANITDAAKKTDLLKAFEKDLTAMSTATDLKAKSNTTSNQSWDSSREDLEDLLHELAPEGSDPVWSPTLTNVGEKGNTLLATVPGGGSAPDAPAGQIGDMSMISLADMVKAFPALAPYQSALVAAGQKYNIPPQLLAAQAMQESHANPNEGNGGMMQFIPSTWAAYGDPSIQWSGLNSSNAAQQIAAAAKYDADLMAQHGGDLQQALRTYNGPVSAGANGSYIPQIAKWMQGRDGYGS